MERTNKQYALIVGVVVTAIVVMLVFAGCTTANKVTKFTFNEKNKEFSHQLAQKVFNACDSLAADYCATKHPCKDSVHESLRYVIGEPVVTIHDSLIYDTVTNTVQKVVVKYITKSILQVDTVYKDKVVYQTDKAQISVIKGQLAQSKQQSASAVKSAKKWRVWTIYTSISLILLVLVIAVHTYLKSKR